MVLDNQILPGIHPPWRSSIGIYPPKAGPPALPSADKRQAGSGWLLTYCVYVLKSTKDNGIYIGLSANVGKKVREHNAGHVKSTKGRRPFVLIHKEEFNARWQAREREKYLKSGIGREFLQTIPR